MAGERLYRTGTTLNGRCGSPTRQAAAASCSAPSRTGNGTSSRTPSATTATRRRSRSAPISPSSTSSPAWSGRQHALVGRARTSSLLMAEDDHRVSYPYFLEPGAGPILARSWSSRPRSSAGTTVSASTCRPGTTRTRSPLIPWRSCRMGRTSSSRTRPSWGSDWEVDETSQTSAGDERRRGLRHRRDSLGRSDGGVHRRPGYERVRPVARRGDRPRGGAAAAHRRPAAAIRSVWGSSLGGVVSFYSVWQHPDVFGWRCACRAPSRTATTSSTAC